MNMKEDVLIELRHRAIERKQEGGVAMVVDVDVVLRLTGADECASAQAESPRRRKKPVLSSEERRRRAERMNEYWRRQRAEESGGPPLAT